MSATKTISRLASVFALALTCYATPGLAAGTPEQRQHCTGDAFRLCASEIPNVERITACMRRQKSKLSPACAAVFDKPAKTVATAQ